LLWKSSGGRKGGSVLRFEMRVVLKGRVETTPGEKKRNLIKIKGTVQAPFLPGKGRVKSGKESSGDPLNIKK